LDSIQDDLTRMWLEADKKKPIDGWIGEVRRVSEDLAISFQCLAGRAAEIERELEELEGEDE
jgi:hypothetical protein